MASVPTENAQTITLTVAEVKQDLQYLREAEERIAGGMVDWITIVNRLYNARAWLTLGYDSWQAMAEGENLHRAWRSKYERDQMILLLDAEGLTTRPISAVTGTSQSTVNRVIQSATESSDSVGPDAQVIPLPGTSPESTPEQPKPTPPAPASTKQGLDGKQRTTTPKPKPAKAEPTRWDGQGTLVAVVSYAGQNYEGHTAHWTTNSGAGNPTLCGQVEGERWNVLHNIRHYDFTTHEPRCAKCQMLSIPAWLWEAIEPKAATTMEDRFTTLFEALEWNREGREGLVQWAEEYHEPPEDEEPEEEPEDEPEEDDEPEGESSDYAVWINRRGNQHIWKKDAERPLCKKKGTGGLLQSHDPARYAQGSGMCSECRNLWLLSNPTARRESA